jgi:HlyD family secretion protein
MKPALRTGIVAALILAALAWAGWRLLQPDAIAVTLHRVARGPVENTVANTRAGSVMACRRARITPAASGQVARLLVRKGARVAEGALLLELWNRDLEAARTLAERELAAAEARINEACVQADNSAREAKRLAALATRGLVARELAERGATLASAQTAACSASRANRAVAEQRITAARVTLERTRLYAPFAGVVADLTIEIGEFVTPSPPGIPTPPAVDLIDDTCLYVSAPIDEVDAPRIRPGLPARITLDAFPGQRYQATVQRIAPYVQEREKQARTVEVEVRLEANQRDAALLTGYSADIEVVLETRADVLRIPSRALLEGSRVLVANADDVLESRPLRTGLANWEYTEIVSGLKAGERVVTVLDDEAIKPGVRVTASPGS